MATLFSFVSLVVALILVDTPIALWLGTRHKRVHAVVAGSLVVMALAGWAMNTATAWYNSTPERLAVLKTEMVQTSEKILRLINHPEDRKDHPITSFTKDPDLRRMVEDTQNCVIFVPRGEGIASDMHGHTTYDLYMIFDDGVICRQELQLFFRYDGKKWKWIQAVFLDGEEVKGALGDEPGIRDALDAWYNP